MGSTVAKRAALFAASCGFALLVFPLAASAQLREFTGHVDTIAGETMTVDNRMGDKVSFARTGETVVRGEKKSWSEIAHKDRVTVSWKFVDKPRKAYVVHVLPPKPGGE